MTKTKYLKPQKGNPHRLAIRQHILPVKSIARFSKSDGRVWVFEKLKNAKRRAKPSDEIFCARRAWDERTEVDFMKKIEDEFQTLAILVELIRIAHRQFIWQANRVAASCSSASSWASRTRGPI
jgi:hypothetical protein